MCLIYELIWLDDFINDSFDFPYSDREFGEVIRVAGSGSCYRFALSCCKFELVVAGSFWESSTLTWEFRMGCDVAGSIHVGVRNSNMLPVPSMLA